MDGISKFQTQRDCFESTEPNLLSNRFQANGTIVAQGEESTHLRSLHESIDGDSCWSWWNECLEERSKQQERISTSRQLNRAGKTRQGHKHAASSAPDLRFWRPCVGGSSSVPVKKDKNSKCLWASSLPPMTRSRHRQGRRWCLRRQAQKDGVLPFSFKLYRWISHMRVSERISWLRNQYWMRWKGYFNRTWSTMIVLPLPCWILRNIE